MTEHKVTKKIEDDQMKTRCGVGRFRPRWLQAFNNAYWLCGFMSAYAFIYGFIANGVNNINTASYERRFSLSSETAGWVSASNDVSSALLGILIGFLGANKNKAKWVAGGALTTGIGCLLMGLPHYLTGMYKWGKGDNRLCIPGGMVDAADSCVTETVTDSNLDDYVYLLMTGHFLNGVSGSTMLTVGMAYIDDSLSINSAPLYQAIVYVFLYLGVAGGFTAGGQSLSLYVDFDQVPKEEWELTPDDPRWVGAWWLSFFFAGGAFILLAIVFFLYGEEMPNARELRKIRLHQNIADNVDNAVAAAKADAESQGQRVNPEHFVLVTKRLMRKLTFSMLCLGYSLTFFLITGLAVFLSKIIQNQFGKSGSLSAVLAGVVIIPGAGLGQFLGGILVKKMKLTIRGCLKLATIFQLCGTPLMFVFFIYCDVAKLVGLNAPYPSGKDSNPTSLFNSTCNSGCTCSLDLYEPVCDVTGLQYFSPCFAGCSIVADNQTKSYTNCMCTDGILTSSSCDRNCWTLYLLMAGLFVNLGFLSALFIPIQTVIFRVSGEADKTLAIGILWFFARVLGAIPGPVAMGAVIDVTCVVWSEKCGIRGSCWVYDNASLGRNVSLLCGATSLTATLLFFIAYKAHPIQQNQQQNMDNGLPSTDHKYAAAVADYGIYPKSNKRSRKVSSMSDVLSYLVAIPYIPGDTLMSKSWLTVGNIEIYIPDPNRDSLPDVDIITHL